MKMIVALPAVTEFKKGLKYTSPHAVPVLLPARNPLCQVDLTDAQEATYPFWAGPSPNLLAGFAIPCLDV